MFRPRPDGEVDVFLPDASAGEPPGTNQPRDGQGPGVPHIARLFVQKAGTDGSKVDDYDIFTLTGHEVTFIAGDEPVSGPVARYGVLAGLPAFDTFASDVALADAVEKERAANVHVAGATHLGGGTLMPLDPPVQGVWTIQRLNPETGTCEAGELTYWMNWKCDTVRLIRITARSGKTIDLPVRAPRVIIGNRPVSEPLENWLLDVPVWNPPTPGQDCDHHFRWFYWLLSSTAGEGLTERLKAQGGSPMPCYAGSPSGVRGLRSDENPASGAGGLRSDEYPTCFSSTC
jgi:hypothetical protein